MKKYRISNTNHAAGKWFVQQLARDFILEDVWEYPLLFKESEGDSLYVFRKQAIQPMIRSLLVDPSLSGMLFRFRQFLGRASGIDNSVNQLPIPGCKEISLSDRMSTIEKTRHCPEFSIDLESDHYISFREVYAFADETLNELSNATEHSLMHYAWIQTTGDQYKVQMAVYVKHRNALGTIYMKLIRPFRHYVVYPYLFGQAIEHWNAYKSHSHGEIAA